MTIIHTLFAFFITGICIGILFDLFRISRKTFKTPNILIYIEDILFWVLTGLIILFTIFTRTNGEIRFYMIVIMIFSCFIYFFYISKHFININTKIISYIIKIIKILLKPVTKTIDFCKKITNFKKNSKKICKN